MDTGGHENLTGTRGRPLRILFVPETFNLGETSRAVEVARHIEREGHEARFAGYSTRFAEHVREAGFSLDLLAPTLTEEQADRLIAVDQGRSIRHPFSTEMVRRRVASERELIARWRPDCVVIGSTMTLLISARAAGVPLVYVRPYAMSRGHLTRMTTFPATSGSGRWARTIDRVAGRAVRLLAPRIRWKPASFRRVAAEEGVALPSRTIDALDADLNLMASLFPSLDMRPLSPGEIAVGPIYAQGEGELPERIARLAGSDRPVIYVGLGSSAGRRLAIDVLRQLTPLGIEVVSSAGRYLRADDRRRLPDNVHVFDHLPAHRLAGIIDASVIHGGEGTVQTACASGAPFAGIGLQAEQRINLEECVRYGNAVRFTPRDLRRGRLVPIVARLLSDVDMMAAARRLRPRAQPVGAVNAAREIIDHVAAPGP